MYLYLNENGNILMTSGTKLEKGFMIDPFYALNYHERIEVKDDLPEKFEKNYKVEKGNLVHKETKEKIKLK